MQAQIADKRSTTRALSSSDQAFSPQSQRMSEHLTKQPLDSLRECVSPRGRTSRGLPSSSRLPTRSREDHDYHALGTSQAMPLVGTKVLEIANNVCHK